MRTTETLQGVKAREAVIRGVNAIYKPVATTFGPQGKNALLFRTFNRGSRITNDGYTVAEAQEPKDIFIRICAAAFKEACKRTNEKVGDGTTGTAIIGGVLMNNVYTLLTDGQSQSVASGTGKLGVMTIKKNIIASATKIKEMIKESALKVETLEDLEKIAIVSVEDEDLGKIIAKMAWEVGVDGFIDTVEGYKGEIETEVIKGFRFPAKIAAKAFVNNPARYEMVAEDCAVWITNYALDNIVDSSTVASTLAKENGISKLIVIAPSFSDNVLVDWVKAVKSGYFIYPVAAPSLRTEQFQDLAIYCGATFIDKKSGRSVRNVKGSDLGFLEKLIVKDTEAKEDAVATGGKGTWNQVMTYTEDEEREVRRGDEVVTKKTPIKKEKISTAIAERIEMLKGQLDETRDEPFKNLMKRRIASMASAVGIIRVGDSTQASALYRKLKIEDAVYACKAALRGGYVRGGGLCLKDIAETIEIDDPGNILIRALKAPYEQIQASIDGGIAIGKDIIDPMEAVYYSFEHATQVVANLATVDVITQETEDILQGDGELAVARALGEVSIALKTHFGQLQASEQEAERDRLKGLTVDEIESMDNG